MTDGAKNLSYLTATSVMDSMDSISYLTHIHTPRFAKTHPRRGPDRPAVAPCFVKHPMNLPIRDTFRGLSR